MPKTEDFPIEIFVSYSHKDEMLKNELIAHLSFLEREGYVKCFHDRKIMPGSEWKTEIDKHLAASKIILLLVSVDFIQSNYCYEKEMMYAMELHKKQDAIVIPIILRECDWEGAEFAKLLALPKDGKAIKSWSNKDRAFKNIAVGIRNKIVEITSKEITHERKVIDFCEEKSKRRPVINNSTMQNSIAQTLIGSNNIQIGSTEGNIKITSEKRISLNIWRFRVLSG